MLTLYTTPLSANGRKVLAAAQHLGLSPEVKHVNVYSGEGRTAEYLAINPSGKIPTLVDGDFVLSESNAILVYLAEMHAEHQLSSRTARDRANISRWLFWEASAWQPALTTVMAPVVAQRLGLVPALPAATASWDDAAFRRVAVLLDEHLGGNTFMVGDRLTIVDFSIAGMMTYARAAQFPFGSFTQIAAWYERIEQSHAWQATATAPWK